MFVKALLGPSLLAAAQLVIPFGIPKPIEQPRAPVEVAGPRWAVACKDHQDDWDRAAPPVRIHGNTYDVGTCGITALLIVGDAGDILIDGTTENGSDVVADNIRKLGFRVEDIKLILHSHEHFDHVGGIAHLQALSGATLVASPAAAKVFATGAAGIGDPQAGMHKPFPAATVGRVVQDGEQVRLGNLMLTAMATPGHTPGALSWRWVSCDGGECWTIVYADSLSPISRDNYRFSDHQAYLTAFRNSIAKIGAIQPCDILITPHPQASDMMDRFLGAKPLMDPNGCRDYAADRTRALDERIAKEAAGKPAQ